MRLSIPLAAGLLSLVLVGGGCSSTSPYATDDLSATDSTAPATTAATPGPSSASGSAAEASTKANDGSTMVEKQKYAFPGVLPAAEIQNKQIRVTTSKGEIVFELYPNTAPKTVSNFVYLAGSGYYDGLTFHRFVQGFVIQGGDPTGTGTSGPGYKFEDELNDEYKYDRGIVAMANNGKNTNGSQFFIMLKDTPISQYGMQKLYTIFGRVTEGMDVVDKLREDDVMTTVVVEAKE